MNKHTAESDLAAPKVTTGPIAGSRKIYARPDAAPDLRVPLREIALDASSGEPPPPRAPPPPVCAPPAPATAPRAASDGGRAPPRSRLACVQERGGVEEYDG